MYSQLVVIHRARTEGSLLAEQQFTRAIGQSADWLLWETCLRQVGIGFLPKPQLEKCGELSACDYFVGAEARQFLLETVCGLKSPVRGETEVHGQFRKLFEALELSHPLYKILQSVHLEARKVRTSHLRGLGSQSYGSLARRVIKNTIVRAGNIEPQPVHILGAGSLAREILPWLAKLNLSVVLHVRDIERHQDLTQKFNFVQLVQMRSDLSQLGRGAEFVAGTEVTERTIQTLLITAPLSASEILASFPQLTSSSTKLILDYRAESRHDSLISLMQDAFGVSKDKLETLRYLNVDDIFREIENTKQQVEERVLHAQKLIQSLCTHAV